MAVNHQVVKGNIGQVKVLNEGTESEFISISLCSSEYMGKDEAGEPKYADQWFNATFLGGKAKLFKSSGAKTGDFVEVEGPHRSRKTEKDGKSYENWAVVVEKFDILRRKADKDE